MPRLPRRAVLVLMAVGGSASFNPASASVGAPSAAQPAAATAAPTPPAPVAPVAPADRGSFAAIWVTPIATYRFQGAGVEGGYRYRWLAGVYRLGFLQNGYHPVEGPTAAATLARTLRILLELEIDGQWRFSDRGTLALGVGAAFMGERVDIAATDGATWTTTNDGRSRIRPLVSATIAGPIFETSVVFYLGSNPEARLSLGVCWGRHARR